MGDAGGLTYDGMTHYGGEMTHVCGMTHDDVAAAGMFYNDNGISASAHSNNSVLTNCMGVVNKTLP